jgi:hypothetical protein
MRRGRRENDERWKGHLSAAAVSGQNLAAYAREHGLNRKTLYAARKRLGESKAAAAGESAAVAKPRVARMGEAFVAVKIKTPEHSSAWSGTVTSTMRARLPNGILIEYEPASLGVSLERWLITLMALPCSGSTRS